MTQSTKLNKKKTTPKTVFQVATAHNLQLGVSANGNLQFKKEPLQHLYELTVSTLFGKSTFYRTSDTLVQSLRVEVLRAVDMKAFDFIANVAVHARGEMNIRTIPIVLVVEFAKALADRRQPILKEIEKLQAINSSTSNQETLIKDTVAKLQVELEGYTYRNMRQLVCDVIQRADQINDMYAYALDVFGSKGKIPMAIKRGVGDAFNKFGAYGFAKYNRDGAVKFRDVLRIVHPDAKDIKQGQIFKQIMEESLQTPYTWETELSANGQLPVLERKSKKDLWTELLVSGKIGYMALLRNLRNIAEAGVDDAIIKEYVADIIADEARVAASRQLTFDFIQAYDVVKGLNTRMATAVSKAIDASVKYLPELGKKPWIIIDYSGSMSGDAVNTATLLAAALLKANESATNLGVTMFGSSAKTLKGVDINNSVLGIQRDLLSHRKGEIAGSTNFYAGLQEAPKLGFIPDTVIVFTDGEINAFPYQALKLATGNSNVVKITVNLNGAPTTPFIKAEGWYTMSGWTPAMFKWVPAIRNKETVVDALSGSYIGLKKIVQEETTD